MNNRSDESHAAGETPEQATPKRVLNFVNMPWIASGAAHDILKMGIHAYRQTVDDKDAKAVQYFAGLCVLLKPVLAGFSQYTEEARDQAKAADPDWERHALEAIHAAGADLYAEARSKTDKLLRKLQKLQTEKPGEDAQ